MHTPRPLVAVVEDEQAIADAVAARLRADGFDVAVAADGNAGLAPCLERRPDVVVLDLMLARLSDRPGAVLGREQLLADVWGWREAGSTTRTVDSHVAALRRKLGDGVVRTVHGVGYALGDVPPGSP